MTHPLILFIVGLSCAATSPLAAAGDLTASGLLERLDRNGDALLASDEVAAEHRILFRRMCQTSDADGDGMLSAAELANALQPRRPEKPAIEKQGSRIPGADALLLFAIWLDVNADGRIELPEVPNRYRRLTRQLLAAGDRNKDGQLDRTELSRPGRLGLLAAQAAQRMDIDVRAELAEIPARLKQAVEQSDARAILAARLADPEQAAELFEQFDANGDGQLVADELPAALAERYERLVARVDRNNDQQLSRQEFQRLAARPQQGSQQSPKQLVRRLLSRFDRDSDGRLTREEAPQRLEPWYDQADANEDGRLDEAELLKWAKKLASAREQ